MPMWYALTARPRVALLLTPALLAGAGGCSSVRVQVTPEPGAPTMAPLPADSVRVFSDTAEVPKPYRVVARLRAQVRPILNSRAVIGQLRERAGALGANGIVVTGGVGFGLGSSTRDSVLAVRVGAP
jgi:hypothetical protein